MSTVPRIAPRDTHDVINQSEPFVDVTVRAILASARTGDVGDGKVFVLDVNQVHRIRTGERDEQAVTPAETVEA